MAVAPPCYASTEWVDLGHAILRFRPKRKATQSLEGNQINCYLSAVYIREYGQKQQPVMGKETKTPKNDLKPPGIPPEIWIAWEEYWKAWKEVLIPLSWVQKYRNQCTPEYIKWHDSYVQDYPEVIPAITEELGRHELSGNITNQSLENKAFRLDNEADPIDYDFLYSTEQKEDDQNGCELQDVCGVAGTTVEKECEANESETNECDVSTSKQSSNSKDSPSVSKLDLTEFYGEIYGEETPETSQTYDGEVSSNDVIGANSKQECSEEAADGNPAANTTTEESEEKRRKVLDELYEKHTRSRYWVHLRSFLHLSGIECHPEIEEFYENNAGIKFMKLSSADSCRRRKEDTEGMSCVINERSCSIEKEHQSKERHTKGRIQPPHKGKKNIIQDIHASYYCKEHEIDTERLKGSSSVPQRESVGSIVKEKLNGDSNAGKKNSELGGMEGEVSNSGGEGSIQTVAIAPNKQKVAKKRKKDLASSQGLGWVLKHVQQKESKHMDEMQRTSELTSMSSDPQEGDPEPPEASPRTCEVANVSPEPPYDSTKVTLRCPDATPESPEAIHEASGDTYEEDDGVSSFLDWLEETDRVYQKNYDNVQEEKALREALKEEPTGLSKFSAACKATMNKAAAALQELFLPLTAIHLLTLSFPGAAAIEYESSVTEDVPGEREKLKLRFDSFVYDKKERLKHYLKKLGKFCLTMWTDAVMPFSFQYCTNLVFHNASGIEHQFPPSVFGVRWIPEPESSFHVDGKNIKRCQRRFHKWLEVLDPNLSLSATVELRGMIMNRMNYSDHNPRKAQHLYQQVVRQERQDRREDGHPCLSLHTLHLLQRTNQTGVLGGSDGVEGGWDMKVTFDSDGFSGVTNTDRTSQMTHESTEDLTTNAEAEMWNRIISGCHRLTFWETDSTMPQHLPQELQKYWAQRYRLFLKYDEGIKLDTESWYSVTPELLAAHQARRCTCKVVVDAFCGAGGNAIQLAKTCDRVIAIDKDPKKVHLARNNAEVYGVAHRIEFRVGDFFKLAPSLKADVVYLSPPWGGIEYQEESVYNVHRLGGSMNCAHLLRTARSITPNVALYLPRNSNLCQVIALAELDGVVDLEASYMGPKKKAITAYFGDLATKTGWC